MSRRPATPGRVARPNRAGLLALLLALLLPVLTAQAQAPPCSTGNPTPDGAVSLPAIRLQQSFTQTCTGILQNVTFTPVQSSNTTIANIIYDMRETGYFVRCNLKDAAGNTLATTPGTDRWYPGATIVFNFSAANLLLTTGTVYSWELEETTGRAFLNLLHSSPFNTNEYAGGSLTQDGVSRPADARKWVVNTAPAVAAGTIAGPLCAGAAVSVPFTANGTIRAGNVYTAQLSNTSGSFAAPVSIGTLSSTAASGTFTATVPAGTASGTGYRIRVSASTAGFAPVPNPSDLTINGTAAPTGAASQRFLPGATVNDLAATGTAVKWYAATSGGTALAPTTPLVNGTVYYATQTVGGLESCNRLAVTAAVVAVAPTVTTTAATLLTGPTATLGGNVTADGGAAITARGVVYSTSNPAPTLNGANVITAPATLGTGTGNFTVSVTGLSVGTRYYVRAYATNVQGVSYGEVQQLTPAYPYRALALTGFTADVVAEASPFSNSPLNLTNNNFDGGAPGFVLYERGYAGVNTAPRGLPAGGSFISAVKAGLPYQFGSYTGGNSLRLAAGGSGTLTPGPRPVAKTLYVLVSSGGAATTMTLTLNFVGAGSQTTASLPVADWFYSSGGALVGFDRVQRTTTTRQSPENNSGSLRLYEIAVPIAPGNQDKMLSSVTVHNTGGSGILHVMALSVELTPLLLTQATTYDNALQLVTVPAGTTATAQGWGGGGGGADNGFMGGNSMGGGGGGYTTATLEAGSYVLSTGAGGASGDGNGAASTLTTASGTPVLLAAGGTSGLNGGAGGRAADSTPGSPSAVSGTNGGRLDFFNGALTGGIGGTAGGPGGGAGGIGGSRRANSAPGAAPGGGGGGGSTGGGTDGFGSAGGAGRLVLTPALPLPVELVAFTAQASGPAAVRLAWATASEKNSAHFEVERSLDGRTFAPIGTVAAAGSSSAPRRYDFLDRQHPGGASLLYYRLRQVDLDGTFSFSPVRTVALPGAAAGLALYPNPAPGGVATLTGAAPGTVVTVYDVLGRQVTAATADAVGTAAVALPEGFAAGVYVVRIGTTAMRLVVE